MVWKVATLLPAGNNKLLFASADHSNAHLWIIIGMSSPHWFSGCLSISGIATATPTTRVWKSPLSTEHRLRLFRAMVEPVLLYGCETWTVNQEMLDRLNGCYTRLLRIAHSVDWTAHARNLFLYCSGTIPPLADTITRRTIRFAGHAFRAKDQLVPDIIMFEPRPTASKLSYLKTPCHLTGATKEELPSPISDRDNWKVVVARSTMSAR